MTTSTPVSSFRLGRQRLDLRLRTARLAARTWITPTYVRIRLEGAELIGFDSPGSDDHIRVFFPDVAPTSAEELRAAPNRELTPLAWESDGGWLELEFAVHDGGVAAQWAAHAPIGAVAGVGGPRGSMLIEGRPDAWFLAGDETAVPAMRRFARTMDAAAVGRIVVEVVDAEHELPIDAPPGVVVEQLHRGTTAPGSALAERLETLGSGDRPLGDVFAFVAAEQAIVRPARALLQERWALPADTFVAKGYWKRGESEYHAPH